MQKPSINSDYIRISYTLTSDSPIHPDLRPVSVNPQNQISEGDVYNTSIITAENHSGTHVDAPAHFLKDGRPIYGYDPNELVFYHPMIVNCPKKPDELVNNQDLFKFLSQLGKASKDVDCLLIHTGFGMYHDVDTETYLTKNPGISPEAVSYLRENLPKLACLGIDTVSMSRYGRKEEAIDVHQTAFKMVKGWGKPLILVEDLDLSHLNVKIELEAVLVVPWQVGGIDSAPCTVLAQLKQTK
jgi:arylformamidase